MFPSPRLGPSPIEYHPFDIMPPSSHNPGPSIDIPLQSTADPHAHYRHDDGLDVSQIPSPPLSPPSHPVCSGPDSLFHPNLIRPTLTHSRRPLPVLSLPNIRMVDTVPILMPTTKRIRRALTSPLIRVSLQGPSGCSFPCFPLSTSLFGSLPRAPSFSACASAWPPSSARGSA